MRLSKTIEANRKAYYGALQAAQKSNEITPWIEYFVSVILDAQKQARLVIHFILQKSRFFDRYKDLLNERQSQVIKRKLDAGPKGFQGGMTANKYIAITKTSKATATRDLQQLHEWQVLLVEGAGRNTRYQLNI